MPHDLSVLAELRPILIELSDLELCASLFQDSFTHHQATFPTGQVSNLSAETSRTDHAFDLMEIFVLADLYNTLGQHEQAIHTIRKGCRWLQGRAAQKFWDSCEDDREWDVPAVSNTSAISGGRTVGDGEVQPGMYPLDVNARHRLAIARIKMGDITEGKVRQYV